MEAEVYFIDTKRNSGLKTPSRKVSEHEPATFEEAVTATKFGKFNIMLGLLAMLATFCSMFDTTSMSYTLVVAQCDLDLSLNDKGLVNAATYAGMISSAVVWGFLFDVLGRKRLLTIGLLVDAIFVFMSGFSQDLLLLAVSKFLQGFIINGPFAALSSYISEFHCSKYRPSFQVLIGACSGFAALLLPMIAWLILPRNMDFSFLGLNFHSWNIFLFVTGMPAFLSGLTFLLFPESPKFLMSCGENEKALKIFRRVYRINTGLPADTYPIKRLVDETKLNNNRGDSVMGKKSQMQALREGFRQIKPLFLSPHLPKCVLTCGIQVFGIMSQNMLRLWLPQIFQVMTDYQAANNGSSASLCTMLSILTPKNQTTEECVVNSDNSQVYINSIIVGFTTICGNTVAGFCIRLFGKKKVLLVAQVSGGICCICMYFSKEPWITVTLSSIFIACGSISNNVTIAVTVDLFPTTLRTLAIALEMMTGRIGAMSGNFMFPFLLQSGCGAPFFVVGSFLLMAAILTLFVPNTDNQALS